MIFALWNRPKFRLVILIGLLILIFTGIIFRFSGVNWNQAANLHPDEYGLTNTLTQLSIPKNLADYFNTRISPISPYIKYDVSGQKLADGPDNRMRWGQWPMLIIRWLAEATKNTGYDELRIMGRYLSAILDVLTLLLTFLIGRHLYNTWVGLLGAALSSLAVMQIQQSHFMTVDNYAVFFTTLSIYIAVRIAQQPPLIRQPDPVDPDRAPYRVDRRAIIWYLLFGISFGMALTSKINLLPLGGMLLVAAFISLADLKLRYKPELKKIFLTVFFFIFLAAVVTLATFRLTQPMSFRAPTGDTTIWTLNLNPDWVESMNVAQQESSGVGGGPPAEQWADRPVIVFPLMNMIVWGMGIPLGLAAWAGFAGAGFQIVRGKKWRAHLLPVIWTGGYFLFMATRWVKSIRYFLPVYPFLCLLAAWGLVELFIAVRSATQGEIQKRKFKKVLFGFATLSSMMVIGGTLVWATAFTNAVYQQTHTRIQATQWILANIPGPFHIQLTENGQNEFIPVGAPEGLQINPATPFLQPFKAQSPGKLAGITLPHIQNASAAPVDLVITIGSGPDGMDKLDQTTLHIPPSTAPRGVEVQGVFQGAEIKAGEIYTLTASTSSAQPLVVYRNTIANEDWDEGLPVPYAGYDPFGQLYQGLTMPVRWTDDENKRQAYLKNLETVDYIILPSQRSIWSISRLPRMYPMTIEYYRALFDGRLGFDLAALFQAPYKIGPLELSDAGGTLAWNAAPKLPVFNFNFFAAEEAFTVYDHPPVWIFRKQAGFSMAAVQGVLSRVDLSQAVFQSPLETKVTAIK